MSGAASIQIRLPSPSGSTERTLPTPSTWPCTHVAAERLARPERRFDVDLVARREAPERRAAQGLRDGVERELVALDRDDGEADAADRDGVAEGGPGGGRGRRRDAQPHAAGAAVDPGDAAALPHDAGEHGSKASGGNPQS